MGQAPPWHCQQFALLPEDKAPLGTKVLAIRIAAQGLRVAAAIHQNLTNP